MDNRKNDLILIIFYLCSFALISWMNNVLVTFFVILVLMIYHIIMVFFLKKDILEHQENEKKRLLHKLSKTEKQTSAIENQFNAFSNIIDSGLLLIDDKEQIIKTNQVFLELFHEKSLVNLPYAELKRNKNLYLLVEESYIREKRIRNQIMYNHLYLDVLVSPVFETGVFKGSLVIVTDITQLKTAETFQKQFTADVSHELKTPLSAIIGIAEILLDQETMPLEERADFIKTIYKESTRLDAILSDLLIISKMDRLDYELRREPTDMKILIIEAVNLLSPMAKEKKLNLNHNITDISLNVDAMKMKQVIINLLKNSINYTDQGSIDIESYIDHGNYIITVKDTGIGIKLEEQQNIFKRFYRVDEARSRASGGSGLGLSIIKNVVKKHQGSIELVSEVNRGSTFKIILPIEYTID